MLVLQNFINGHMVPSASSKTLDIIDPSTGEVYATSPDSNQADIDMAMAAATEAFAKWK